jgi:hypothetical protein
LDTTNKYLSIIAATIKILISHLAKLSKFENKNCPFVGYDTLSTNSLKQLKYTYKSSKCSHDRISGYLHLHDGNLSLNCSTGFSHTQLTRFIFQNLIIKRVHDILPDDFNIQCQQ